MLPCLTYINLSLGSVLAFRTLDVQDNVSDFFIYNTFDLSRLDLSFQKHEFIPSSAKFRLLLGELGSNLIIQLDRTFGNLSGEKISPRMNALINRPLHFIKDASYASTNLRTTLNVGAG